jgi:hypothetical protein
MGGDVGEGGMVLAVATGDVEVAVGWRVAVPVGCAVGEGGKLVEVTMAAPAVWVS